VLEVYYYKKMKCVLNIREIDEDDIDKFLQVDVFEYDIINGSKNNIGVSAEQINELFPNKRLVYFKREPIYGIDETLATPNTTGIIGYKTAINETTGEPIPEGVYYDKLFALGMEVTQNLNDKINVIEDELCSKDQNHSWCPKP